jgi:hypothetical protein
LRLEVPASPSRIFDPVVFDAERTAYSCGGSPGFEPEFPLIPVRGTYRVPLQCNNLFRGSSATLLGHRMLLRQPLEASSHEYEPTVIFDFMDSDADKIIDLYKQHAYEYVADRRLVGWNENAWLDRFSALLPRGASILDVGCGYGEPIAKYLVDKGFAVDEIDASPLKPPPCICAALAIPNLAASVFSAYCSDNSRRLPSTNLRNCRQVESTPSTLATRNASVVGQHKSSMPCML